MVCSAPGHFLSQGQWGHFLWGVRQRKSTSESETGGYCEAGTSYQHVLTLDWKTDLVVQWDSWSICWEVAGQQWRQVWQTRKCLPFLTPIYRRSRRLLHVSECTSDILPIYKERDREREASNGGTSSQYMYNLNDLLHSFIEREQLIPYMKTTQWYY